MDQTAPVRHEPTFVSLPKANHGQHHLTWTLAELLTSSATDSHIYFNQLNLKTQRSLSVHMNFCHAEQVHASEFYNLKSARGDTPPNPLHLVMNHISRSSQHNLPDLSGFRL